MATLEHPTPAGHFHPLYPAESTNRMRYSDPFPGPQLPAIKRPASAETHPLEPPVKKQSKWSAEENDLIIKLRGDGLKWEEVSRHLPGRSAISCRLHYQNFLERRPLWDEEKKNKLARLYERFRKEMWEKVAKELHMPWRAAEDMHWTLGKHQLAQRAGVTPFAAASDDSTTIPASGVPITTSFGLATGSFRPAPSASSSQPPIQPAPTRQSSMSMPPSAYSSPTGFPGHPSFTSQPANYLDPQPMLRPASTQEQSGHRSGRSTSGTSPSPRSHGSFGRRSSPQRAVSSAARVASMPPMESHNTPPPLPSIPREYYGDEGPVSLQGSQQRLPPVRFLTQEPESTEERRSPQHPSWLNSPPGHSNPGNSIDRPTGEPLDTTRQI